MKITNKTKDLNSKILIIKSAIGIIRPWRSPRCKEFDYGCPTCGLFLSIDLLQHFLDLLKWELKEETKEK